jgi:hypothetical protein
MPYTRTTWQDFPSTATPIDAAALNNIEDFISGDGSSAQWTSFTPTWNNVTLGTGALNSGFYARVGRIVTGRVRLRLGTGGSVSGSVRFGYPVSARSITAQTPVGEAVMLDASASRYYLGYTAVINTTEIIVYARNTTDTYVFRSTTSATLPMTWDVSDEIFASFTYEAA